MSKLHLVAISREPISEKLVFELKDCALKFGLVLHTVGGQISNGAYYSERWESSHQLDISQRENLRSIAAKLNSDLCFLNGDLKKKNVTSYQKTMLEAIE